MIKLIYPKFWSKNGVISILLTPFSFIYYSMGVLRKFFAKPIRFDAKVICVGNITVGGTGKTQIVQLLAERYQAQNKNILIVTKGYGSSLKTAKIVTQSDNAASVGDESKLLSEIAPVVAARKVEYSLPIINKLKPEIIIFDDGMQNPNFIKDYTIIVFDNMRRIGNGKLFPSGPLRQKVSTGIKESDSIVMIGDDECKDNIIQNYATEYGKHLFRAKINLVSPLKNTEYFAFSAIGNPDKFFNTLIKNGAKLKRTKIFPDHHQFTQNEIIELKNIAKKHNYTLITTKKDYVKINDNANIDCTSIELILDNETKFMELINEALS
jgi:tetraacyldisaccharide 4'-kinase